MTKLLSLHDARPVLRDLRRGGRSIGSVHTLGALHAGHARVIALAAEENDHVVVTVYPNKAQLAPGARYVYDLERDLALASAAGATHVVHATDAEMYPPDYATFLDQGERWKRLDGTVVPFLFRGMITMCLRWISLVRPTRTYWGLKDIGQTLLVRRAVEDLLVDTEIREVPCVRYRSGVPISSRLLSLDRASLEEVASVYRALHAAREEIARGTRDAHRVLARAKEALTLDRFRLCYAKLAEPRDFSEPDEVPESGCILHLVVTNGVINHFDGFLLRSEDDVRSGPETIWLDEHFPAGAP